MIRFPEGSRNILGSVQVGSVSRPAFHSVAAPGGRGDFFTMVKRAGLKLTAVLSSVKNERHCSLVPYIR